MVYLIYTISRDNQKLYIAGTGDGMSYVFKSTPEGAAGFKHEHEVMANCEIFSK